jgi:uncharacterized protein with ParB-like and HNH nuclease domain
LAGFGVTTEDQRNYAWDEGEITQLIQDVIDYLPAGRNYYIGTLVVFERTEGKRTVYETIDGQQRLTTLSVPSLSFIDASRRDVLLGAGSRIQQVHNARGRAYT